MTRLQTYYFIGNLLSYEDNPDRREYIIACLKSSNFNWPLFISTASNHLVLQTIYCRLFENKFTSYVPKDVLLHLKQIYDLNSERNNQLIKQVKSINILLNSEGIIPLYMKGIGNIIDGLYQNTAERIMHDIDLMVPDEQWETAANVLLQNGYKALSEYNPVKREKTLHYPPLFKEGTKAVIEIHRLPVNYNFSDTIIVKEVWENKTNVIGYGNSYVMNDQHKVLINFIHSQLKHNGHVFARVHMRNLYDLFLLSKRVDIEVVFADLKKFRSQAAGYLRIMEKLFAINATKIKKLNIRSRIFIIHHESNLRSRPASLISHFIVVAFLSYLKKPLMSINDRELRVSLIKKILDKDWYKRHLKKLAFFYKKTL